MEARLAPGLRKRRDLFGGVCYVPVRDDFFAASQEVYRLIEEFSADWSSVSPQKREGVVALAKLGVCETRPPTQMIAYSGPAFIGEFLEMPTVSEPLVLNCFATAHCPLKCLYCHADDLMQEFRADENDQGLENVAATASMIPAMVAVITGGDPLSSPQRAIQLIEKLAGQKAIVLDTSGVGDIEVLIPHLKKHHVHVRVSLDAISTTNDKIRPPNMAYARSSDASRAGAEQTIKACLRDGIAVTVQTVISARNENETELIDLRDAICRWGVQNWVIHVAIRGGSARRIEHEAERQIRKRGILPSREVYRLIAKIIDDTSQKKLMLDIRCTDTDNTPNSVLLVGSTGDLYTEGLAHNGKVPLFAAGSGRPDLVQSLWFYIDRFGHARRYFNWNPWLAGGRNLKDLCYVVPGLEKRVATNQTVVETEAKHEVRNEKLTLERLSSLGYTIRNQTFQRDEYYDTHDGALSRLDYVVRLRISKNSVEVGLKGPRFYTAKGEYSRVELEFEPKSLDSVRYELVNMGLSSSWFFEKWRIEYECINGLVSVVIDEIPEVGRFIEMEGPVEEIRKLTDEMGDSIGPPETRNYAEIYRAFMLKKGVAPDEIDGAEFGEERVRLLGVQ